MKKQVLSLALSATMLASMLPKPAFAADNTTFPDMPNDWSTQALQNAINNGLLNGIDGKIAASENLTRAQMAAIVTRAFGTNGKADISSFGDVNTGDWFYDAMASSVLMGAFQGDGVNLNPNANITRQEAFTVLARLFTLSGGDQSVLNSYTDGAQVADWAKDSMASMVAAGYVKGSDNKLNPTSSITRAEFAQVMDNLVKTYFADSQLNVNADGNAVLNKAGTLEGATISGDLIIGDGAAEGDVVLKDVTVSGRLLVRGGGTSTVTLEGNTTVGSVVVNKPTGAVRVENNTEKTVNVNAVSDNVVLTGDFNEVNANAAQGTVTLTGATVATMNVAGTSAKVVVSEKSTVETMNVQGSASGAAVSVQSGTTVKTMNTAASKAVVTVNGTVNTMSVAGSDTTVKAEEGAKIEKITTSAANTSVSGQGSVTNFEAAQGASGADITTSGTKVVNNGTGNVTTGNDKVIASGSTGTSESDNTGTTTPDGGGSTGGEDEGTPILPESGIVGVKPVDQSADDKIPEEQMPNVTASAVKDLASGIVTIKLSTDKEVPLHQNANHTEGYWVGVAVEVSDDVNEINYYFGTTASETTNASTSPVTDPTIGDKQYFVAFINAGSTTPKTHLTLQWGENEAVQYVIDLSGVKLGSKVVSSTAASQTQFPAIESTAKGLSRDESAELKEQGKQLSQKEVSAFGGEGGQYVTYYTIPKADVPDGFSKILYSVNNGKELTWNVPSTTGAEEGSGRWTKDEYNYYFKLGNSFATNESGAWVMKDGGVFNHNVKFVLTSNGVDSVVATLNFTVNMTQMGYSIEEVETEGATPPENWDNLSKYTLTADCTLKAGYDVPANKTLVIAEGVTLKVNGNITGAGTVKGADVVLAEATVPNFSKLVENGETKVWTNKDWVKVTEQTAKTRVDGPAKDGTPSFKYGNTYTSAGVTFADNAIIKVAVETTKTFLGSEENATDIENLTQPSGELNGDNGLFFGVQFDTLASAKKVTVYRSTGDAEAKNLGQDNAAFDLTRETVYGGADTYAGAFINYLVFAKADAKAGYIGDNTWNYTFVWQDANDDVIGVSQCTIRRNIAE